MRPISFGLLIGIVVGFCLAELLIDGNRQVYTGIVVLCSVLGGTFGGVAGIRGKGGAGRGRDDGTGPPDPPAPDLPEVQPPDPPGR